MTPRLRQAGFTYLGLIIFVFIIGLVGAATLKIGALLQRAHTEEELLEIGYQFSAALKSYAEATPRGQPTQPMTLQELLRDPRFPNPRRHLRKIFVDPVSGKAEWGLVRAGEGGRILGVHSLSKAAPLKLANFDKRFPGFDNREHIADWKFMADQQGAGAPLAPGARPVIVPMPPLTPGTLPAAPPAPAPSQPQPQPEPEPPKEEPPVEEPPAEEKPAEPPQEPKEPSVPTTQSQDSGR
ncbi:type II secretion system GspH family protein [Massilia sp. IC2-477]|uniref:type II secretion system protein n=1 Tax=Massilia sp. IC2-477 TaxID=2887198 RepID=UPI001D10AADB|nr:type II secretion system GspH family protein [Massilia sp. IC2-477]